MTAQRIFLKSGKEAALRSRHPWIFSGALSKVPPEIQNGDFVEVLDHEKRAVCVGHYQDDSIAVKVLEYGSGNAEDTIVRQHLQEAIALRKTLGLLDSADTNAFRLVHGEADGLPGLVVDLYNNAAVAQFHSEGMKRLGSFLATALRDLLPDRVKSLYQKPVSEKGETGSYLFGKESSTIVSENGLHFRVDWENGQKTGFYLDQRDNRKIVGEISRGRKVLNAFCYTGGFSIYALAGGSLSVTSLDSSETALSMLKENIALNSQCDGAAHSAESVDCLKYLKEMDDTYDLVVLDPPAFIKHRGAFKGGINGYKSINSNAMRHVTAGGLLATFSCSQLFQRQDFLDVLRASALDSGRRLRIIRELHQAPCHPVSVFHPEGEYLKGFLAEVY